MICLDWKSVNPFMVAIALANVLSAIWYFYKGGPLMGLLSLNAAICNVIVILIGVV